MTENHAGLPDYPLERFADEALELCLVQVRYPQNPRYENPQHIQRFQESLSEEYPLPATEQSLNVVVTPQGASQVLGGALRRYTSIDQAWSVVFAPEFVSLEARHYTDIEEFSERFAWVLGQFVREFQPKHRIRFGLRYVNEFRFPQYQAYADWKGALRGDALGLDAAELLGGTVEQTVHELRTRLSDGYVLVRHGYLSGSTVTPLGNAPPKTGPFYLLDLDYYNEQPTSFTIRVEDRMKTYNRALYRTFRWFVGDGQLYRLLRGEGG